MEGRKNLEKHLAWNEFLLSNTRTWEGTLTNPFCLTCEFKILVLSMHCAPSEDRQLQPHPTIIHRTVWLKQYFLSHRRYTCKIYHSDHFKVYSSVALSAFTLYATITTIPPPDLFIFPNWNSVPIKHQFPLLFPLFLATTILLLSLCIWLLLAPHLSGIAQYLSFSDWLISLST